MKLEVRSEHIPRDYFSMGTKDKVRAELGHESVFLYMGDTEIAEISNGECRFMDLAVRVVRGPFSSLVFVASYFDDEGNWHWHAGITSGDYEEVAGAHKDFFSILCFITFIVMVHTRTFLT